MATDAIGCDLAKKVVSIGDSSPLWDVAHLVLHLILFRFVQLS